MTGSPKPIRHTDDAAPISLTRVLPKCRLNRTLWPTGFGSASMPTTQAVPPTVPGGLPMLSKFFVSRKVLAKSNRRAVVAEVC
jgi:hypothetical protein